MEYRKDQPEYNPLKIIWISRWRILSLPVSIMWLFCNITAIILSGLSIYSPNINVANNETLANVVTGGIGILLAILSLNIYSSDDLAILYARGRRGRNLYYEYIAEFLFAALLWVMIHFGLLLKSVISLGDSIVETIVRTAANCMFLSLIMLAILSIVEIFIKSINRKTNKVIIQLRNEGEKNADSPSKNS